MFLSKEAKSQEVQVIVVICCISVIYLVMLCDFLLLVFGILSTQAGPFRNGKYSQI